MSNMRSNCFSFALVTSRQPVFQNCKEILYAPSSGFSSCLEWWYIETLTLLVILHVALFNCLSIIIADQNNSFHGQVGSVIGQISIQRQLSSLCNSLFMLAHIIQRMCAVWGLPYKLYVNKVFMFILHRTKTTLKYLARHTGLNQYF